MGVERSGLYSKMGTLLEWGKLGSCNVHGIIVIVAPPIVGAWSMGIDSMLSNI